MNVRRRPQWGRPWQVLLCAGCVGLGFMVRASRDHVAAHSSQASTTASVSGLPAPERRTRPTPGEGRLPREIRGYQLVSVVPEARGHDLHALYEGERHLSLFKRRLGASRDLRVEFGPQWSTADPVLGYPTFVSRAPAQYPALAWISDGKRHIVMGDLPVEELRTFAVAYERTPRSVSGRSLH